MTARNECVSGRSKLDSPHGPIGEASDWLDKTVNVPTVNSLALPEWMAEFERLKKVNAEIMGGKTGNSPPKRKQTKRR